MQIIKLNKRLIAQFMAVSAALFLVHHYKEHYEEHYLEEHDDERNLLAEERKDADGTCEFPFDVGFKVTGNAERVALTGELMTSRYKGRDAGFVMELGKMMSDQECAKMIELLDGPFNGYWESEMTFWQMALFENGQTKPLPVSNWNEKVMQEMWSRIQRGIPSELELREGYVYKNPRPGFLHSKKYQIGHYLAAHRDDYTLRAENSGVKLTVVINLTGENEKRQKTFEGGATKFMNDPKNEVDTPGGLATTDDLLNQCTHSKTIEAKTGHGFAFDGSLMHGGEVVTKGTKYILVFVIEYEEFDKATGIKTREYSGLPKKSNGDLDRAACQPQKCAPCGQDIVQNKEVEVGEHYAKTEGSNLSTLPVTCAEGKVGKMRVEKPQDVDTECPLTPVPSTKSPTSGASMVNPIFLAIFMTAVHIAMN